MASMAERCQSCFADKPLHSEWITRTVTLADGIEQTVAYCSLRCAGAYTGVEAIHELAAARREDQDAGVALGKFFVSALLTLGGALSHEPMPQGVAANLGIEPRKRRRKRRRRRRG